MTRRSVSRALPAVWLILGEIAQRRRGTREDSGAIKAALSIWARSSGLADVVFYALSRVSKQGGASALDFHGNEELGGDTRANVVLV